MVLTLYKIDASPPVRSVFMAIEALDLKDVQMVDVNLFEGEHLKEEYLKVNPQHTVPMLADDEFYIWDSHAIATYLVTKYGKTDDLYPADPQKRAIIDQRLHFDSGILFPSLRGTVEPVLFCGEKSFRQENLDKIKKAYEFLENFLTSSSPWLAGDKVTLADICCVSTVSSMDVVLPIDADSYPNLASWKDLCSQQQFYVAGNIPGLEQFQELVKFKLR
uniref:Glutathione S-transferase epsilon 12 n=1 Tax=Spodoptera litura TaxID=69820 RepID=A0A075X3R8_SPOLT|nr:glutathione S-transferase epsilon 12 [Spodoptera litura]